MRYRRADERLRGELADSLRTAGLAADHADKVAHWNPYDQNAAADWFDPGYMFGVREGFDVVIGNPPYVQLPKPGSGLLVYITSSSWLKAEYGKATRRWFAENHTPLKLLEMGKDVFENVIVDASILLSLQGKSGAVGIAVDTDKLTDKSFPRWSGYWRQRLRTCGRTPGNGTGSWMVWCMGCTG